MAEKDIEFGKRLEHFIFEAGMNKKAVAVAVKISPSAIGAYINEGRIPEAPIILRIARLLNKSVEELLTGEVEIRKTAEGKPYISGTSLKGAIRDAVVKEESARYGLCDDYKRVDVYHMAGAGNPVSLIGGEPIDTIYIMKRLLANHIVVVKVRGHSMEPSIMSGAYVGVDTNDKNVISGEIYAIWIHGEGAVVKRLHIDVEQKVHIISDNTDSRRFPIMIKSFQELDEHFVLGRIRWVIQEF